MPLTLEEMNALRELARGSVRNRLRSVHAWKFVELGLARPTADGVAITRNGRRQAATAARPGATSDERRAARDYP